MTGLLGTGLVGKLPMHGDFVRRGDDPALLTHFDRWLETELGRAEPAGLADRLAAMPAWRFVLPHGSKGVLGAMVASHDKVGRVFPLLGFIHVAGAPGAEDAAGCCEALEGVLLAASRGERDAPGTLAALGTAACGLEAGDGPVTGRWWCAGEAIAGEALPVGAAFDRLLGPMSADVAEAHR